MRRSEATRDLPADYADGHISAQMCVTLDADANDPASLLAASLAAARLMHVWCGTFECMSFCDPITSHVRLTLRAGFDDVGEDEWSCALSEGLEDLWEDDGGCSDYGRAMELVREDTECQLANWLEERAEELDMGLALRADVSIHDFHIWQE